MTVILILRYKLICVCVHRLWNYDDELPEDLNSGFTRALVCLAWYVACRSSAAT